MGIRVLGYWGIEVLGSGHSLQSQNRNDRFVNATPQRCGYREMVQPIIQEVLIDLHPLLHTQKSLSRGMKQRL